MSVSPDDLKWNKTTEENTDPAKPLEKTEEKHDLFKPVRICLRKKKFLTGELIKKPEEKPEPFDKVQENHEIVPEENIPEDMIPEDIIPEEIVPGSIPEPFQENAVPLNDNEVLL